MKWDEMSVNERDDWVAENVMGFVPEDGERYPGSNRRWFIPPVGHRGENTGTTILATTAPAFTTDAAADYLVLCRVREMGPQRCSEFSDACRSVWSARRSEMYRGLSYSDFVVYEPGDYSRAAYLTLEGHDDA